MALHRIPLPKGTKFLRGMCPLGTYLFSFIHSFTHEYLILIDNLYCLKLSTGDTIVSETSMVFYFLDLA